MFFSLSNSPATFQTMMNTLFMDLIARGKVVVYLDDILIFSRLLEEHHAHVGMVLDRLQNASLYDNP